MRGIKGPNSVRVSMQEGYAWKGESKLSSRFHASGLCVESRIQIELEFARKRAMRGLKGPKSVLVSTQAGYTWKAGSKLSLCFHARGQCIELGPPNRVLAPRKRAMRRARSSKSCASSTQEGNALS